MTKNGEAVTHTVRSGPLDCDMMKTYLRLLDADRDQADWREAAAIILDLDVDRDPQGSRAVFEKLLKQAHWLRDHGYFGLVRSTST
ncbi:hypothetical protein [Gymnodinialimonas hymeniacidonis]|uniref:hypothetical protein n=1 Tax=Gymnodinialimonas hymeniacidonis TaxID=3126508 RepID=UPI0034C627E1